VGSPRWYERFRGTLVRPAIPAGLFDSLALRVEARAFIGGVPESLNEYRVVEPSEDAPVPSGYRVVGDARPSIHIAAVGARTAHHIGLNDVRIWQDGPHMLRYEVGFRRLQRRSLVRFATVAVSGAIGPLLLVATRSAPLGPITLMLSSLWALFAILLASEAAIDAWIARRALERTLDEELAQEEKPNARLRAPALASVTAAADDAEDALDLQEDAHPRSSVR
jgi:hypothetical protein